MNKEIERLHHLYYDLSATIAEKFLNLWDDVDNVKFEGSYWCNGEKVFPKSVQFFHNVVRVLVCEDHAGEMTVKAINEFTTEEMLNVLGCVS